MQSRNPQDAGEPDTLTSIRYLITTHNPQQSRNHTYRKSSSVLHHRLASSQVFVYTDVCIQTSMLYRHLQTSMLHRVLHATLHGFLQTSVLPCKHQSCIQCCIQRCMGSCNVARILAMLHRVLHSTLHVASVAFNVAFNVASVAFNVASVAFNVAFNVASVLATLNATLNATLPYGTATYPPPATQTRTKLHKVTSTTQTNGGCSVIIIRCCSHSCLQVAAHFPR